MKKIVTLLLLLLLGSGLPAWADEPWRPARIERPPVLDGRLDPEEWRTALVVSDFLQRVPREGADASQRTEVRLMYTSTDLFVGLRAYDTAPDRIAASVMRRDNFDVVQNDQFVIAIDSYDDGRNGYWFSTNPLGARVDAQFFEEGEIWQSEWNGIWDCVSQIDAEGWTSELRIPFSTLRFNSAPENTMGINLFRRVVHTNEQLFAPLVPLRYANGTPNVSVARQYLFAGIAAGHDVRVRPHLLGQRRWPATSPGNDVKAGVDASYGLTRSLSLGATVNTDFALAELDDRQINLSRFDLFYPEKRDFFLENGGLFQFGLPGEAELFFSRRVGLAQRADGESVAIPIRLGAKLTGRTGPLELGLLEVRTGGAGFAAENALVVRTKYGFGRRSYAGLIATHKAAAGIDNATLGIDGTVYLTQDVGFSGFTAVTQRAQAGGLAPAWNVALFRRGERRSFRAAVTDVGDGFAPGLGFLLRSGVRKYDADTQLPWYIQSHRVRRLAGGYTGSLVQRHAGGVESWSHVVTATLDLQSDDTVKIHAGRSFDAVPERFTLFRGTPVAPGRYDAHLAGVTLASKPGRTVAGEARIESAGFYGGTRRGLTARAQWKASRSLTTSLDYTSSWVRLPAGRFRAAVLQARADLSWDTRLGGRVLLQYDNASQDLGLNLRLNFLFREGTELSFVYGRREDRQALPGTATAADNAALLKLTWLFHF